MKLLKSRNLFIIFAALIALVTYMFGFSEINSNRNHLGSEKSPYLKQHASNPVWWYAWGDEPFERAKKEKKPIFLSIGYSTCHWCHVMEKECFEDKEVADILNRSFISIKVDREEHPEVDSIYIEAVESMVGSAGWPLSLFLTPQAEPFFGGMYFPKKNFIELLTEIETNWRKDPTRILEQGKSLVARLKTQNSIAKAGNLTTEELDKFKNAFQKYFDEENGGRIGQPKFPPAYALRLLLRIAQLGDDKSILPMVTTTLDQMSRRGIYDHLAGGFHRYTVDENWMTPHFEKMLYDQAALLNIYVEAFQVTGNKEYEIVAREIIEYVKNDLSYREGGFYSAEDADSEGHEGKFYVWTYEELKKALTTDEFLEFTKAYHISEKGNFENQQNILSLNTGIKREAFTQNLNKIRSQLLKIRSQRVRPHRDEKIITAWNGLFIAALARAGSVFNEPQFTDLGAKAAQFILKHVQDNKGRLLRRWANGEAKHSAYLEDYAFFIDALIELYQATGHNQWLKEAVRLQSIQDELFYDSSDSVYFSSAGHDKNVIQRKKEFEDVTLPAGNSVTLLNLLRLMGLTFNEDYQKKADLLVSNLPESVKKLPYAYPQLLMAIAYKLDKAKEIGIVTSQDDAEFRKAKHEFLTHFMPNKVVGFAVGENSDVPLLKSKIAIQGKTTFYVCTNQVCQFPTTDIKKALSLAQ